MMMCVVTGFFVIILERIRGGRAQRRLSPGRYHIDYGYSISDINNNNKDGFDEFEKGDTTSASDFTN